MFTDRELPIRQQTVPDLVIPHPVGVQSPGCEVPEDQLPRLRPVRNGSGELLAGQTGESLVRRGEQREGLRACREKLPCQINWLLFLHCELRDVA